MNIIERIRHIREGKGLTQEDIAERLNTTRSNYAYLEGRGEKLTIEQLQKIADALGVGVGDLMGLGAGSVDKSPREVELEKRVKELDDRVKDKALIIDKMISEDMDTGSLIKGFVEGTIVMYALEHDLLDKELSRKYIYPSFLENEESNFKYFFFLYPEVGKAKHDALSDFMSKHQIAISIKNLGAYFYFLIGNAISRGYLPKIIEDAYYSTRGHIEDEDFDEHKGML